MTRLLVILFIAVCIAILIVAGPLVLLYGLAGVALGALISSILDG